MTIEMLQNARNWAEKHQKFACGWGSAPDPAGGLKSPDPLKWPHLSNYWVRHCVIPTISNIELYT